MIEVSGKTLRRAALTMIIIAAVAVALHVTHDPPGPGINPQPQTAMFTIAPPPPPGYEPSDAPVSGCAGGILHICTPDNDEGKPAGCYRDGVLVAKWPCLWHAPEPANSPSGYRDSLGRSRRAAR